MREGIKYADALRAYDVQSREALALDLDGAPSPSDSLLKRHASGGDGKGRRAGTHLRFFMSSVTALAYKLAGKWQLPSQLFMTSGMTS